uniref:ABC transporter related n=1 Tax=Nitratidesulfovibrio vulgaris (strain DSM 19637 / Miyazaki F) TaxID=883 RepID=B8DIY0_NITV9
MRSEPAIHIRSLGKRYKRHDVQASDTLRDAVAAFVARRGRPLVSREFWALRGIDLDIHPGEVVGVLGRNGAGKSTLLKIISRITSPTTGEIHLDGRVGSLLEVGTGFHHELTGRENIYLNGAILGMSRREVSAKFDEIVEFAGVSSFLDTPIKRYSSGMVMRLAFAVAAHLDPEIMVIDEVLAVGDASFQQKCLGKMKDVTSAGRTVLFVSHNMNAVRQLCTRAILLENGVVAADSCDVSSVVARYLSSSASEASFVWASHGGSTSRDDFIVEKFYLTDEFGGVLCREFASDEKVCVNIEFSCRDFVSGVLSVGYQVFNSFGDVVYTTYTTDELQPVSLGRGGRCHLRSELPVNVLRHGEYVFSLVAGVPGRMSFYKRDEPVVVIKHRVSGNKEFSSLYDYGRVGLIAPVIAWRLVGVETVTHTELL